MLVSARHIVRAAAAAVAAALLVSGCSGPFPADSQGSLARATGGTIYVGATANPPWTEISPDGAVTGGEADLVTDYAESIDAEITWVPGSESVLADRMKDGELDIMIGGLTSKAPWTDKVALTRPYTTVRGEDGTTEKMVMGVRPGENALMVSLETFLDDQEAER